MSLTRIRQFLLKDELKEDDITHENIPGRLMDVLRISFSFFIKFLFNKGEAVNVQNVNFGWSKTEPVLKE